MDKLSEIELKSRINFSEEEKIISSCKKDIRNFSKLYDKYYVQIFRYILQRVECEASAQDICSQVFLKAMQNIQQYTFKGKPFSSWLYTIARNELNLLFREQKYNRVINVQTKQLADFLSEVEETKSNEQRIELLVSLLNNLPEQDIELIEMRYFECRPYAEISDILKKPVGSLKVRVSRIIKRLKHKF